MLDKSLGKKRKVEASVETNSTVPAVAFTMSQHVNCDVSTTAGPAATVDADTGQNPRLGGQFAGYIFMCNAKTKPDCFTYRVFGVPASRIDDAEKIKPSAKLFLFDFDVKLLYGLYVADSIGKLALEPYAFGGRFPAQVKFSIARDCLPLPEAAFKDAIKENYLSKFKFKQDLSYEQVDKLVSLFRPITLRSSHQASLAFHTAAHQESSMNAIECSLHRSVPGFEPSVVLQHSSDRCVQEIPLLPLRSPHNQITLSSGGEFTSDPYRSYIANERYESVLPHQGYHPDDPSFQRPNTHSRYGYIPQQGVNPVAPPVPSANSYYGHDKKLLPTVSLPQMQGGTPSPAAQWAARNQTPGDQCSTFNSSSSYGPGVSHTNKFPNASNYPGNHGAVVVPTEQPVHAYEGHLSSASSFYTQREGDPAVPHTVQPGHSGVGTVNAYSYSGHGYQQYSGSHQTPPVAVYQEVSHVHASQMPPAYGNQEYPNSQVSVPEGSADPKAYGYQNQEYSGCYQPLPVTSEQVTNTAQSQGFPALLSYSTIWKWCSS